MPALFKISISTKLRSLVHFFILSQLHVSLALYISIFKKIHPQMKSLKILICSQLRAKPLVIPLEKDSSVVPFATKCRGRATYGLNVEAIFFAIG